MARLRGDSRFWCDQVPAAYGREVKAAARPTALEASFLAFERAGLPIHVAGVILLDGGEPVTMHGLKQLVAKRLRRLPKFRECVRTRSGGRGLAWVPARKIDYDLHLVHHELPAPGRDAQLDALCSRIHEQALDRSRPLWEIHLIDGLGAGRQALVIKAHHAITDGLAGVEVAEVLCDPAPGTRRPRLPATRFVEPHPPSPFAALQGLLGIAFTAAKGPLVLDGPFNGPVGPERAFSRAALRIDHVRSLKRRLGGSVDDVLVALVAAGLSRYLRDVAYPRIPRTLKAMLPVSTRSSAGGARFGNYVSAVFVDLPMDGADLPSLVERIATEKDTLRTAHAAAGGAMLIDAVGRLPHPVHSRLLRVVSLMPFANLVLSDVPGPDDHLFLLGRRIVACYPMMPLAPRVGLSIAAVSLSGQMGIGVTADPGLVPDPQRLATAIARASYLYEHAPTERSA